ncbi:hypothetical protein [uncultured Erythrobacter sp.]|uniref:hypothetical protein n=1 Tax=uncultured Erythrobacter sp. TaxID=263913 RepID=UPI002622FDAF|nr:hypothetical protein [uncultured Erythrobacter sp.]
MQTKMIQFVRFARIISAWLVTVAPTIAGAVTFNCNTTGNQNSNLQFSIPDQPAVLEGVIKLRRAGEDKEFPAYGLMEISAGPTSLRITMHRTEDTEKQKLDFY